LPSQKLTNPAESSAAFSAETVESASWTSVGSNVRSLGFRPHIASTISLTSNIVCPTTLRAVVSNFRKLRETIQGLKVSDAKAFLIVPHLDNLDKFE
jgi:hypothetical protein